MWWGLARHHSHTSFHQLHKIELLLVDPEINAAIMINHHLKLGDRKSLVLQCFQTFWHCQTRCGRLCIDTSTMEYSLALHRLQLFENQFQDAGHTHQSRPNHQTTPSKTTPIKHNKKINSPSLSLHLMIASLSKMLTVHACTIATTMYSSHRKTTTLQI